MRPARAAGTGSGDITAAEGRSGRGLVEQTIRALRLDPALYREVATSGAGTRQAATVVLLAAVATGVTWGAIALSRQMQTDTAVAARLDDAVAWDSIATVAGASTIAQASAWLVWAAGLWFVGAHLVAPDSQAREFWSLARPLAFAQAPAMFSVARFGVIAASSLILGADAARSPLLTMLDFIVLVAVELWVLIATFVAIRESLRLGTGRTLGVLVSVGLAISGVSGLAVSAAVILSANSALGSGGALDAEAFTRNAIEFGVLAAGGLLLTLGCLLALLGLRTQNRGWLLAALSAPVGLVVVVLLGVNYSPVSWETPGIMGFVVPRNSAAEIGALAVTGVSLLFGSLLVVRGQLRISNGWVLVPVGLVIAVLLGLGVITLALVETVYLDEAGTVSDVFTARAVANGLDFNLGFGVGNGLRVVNFLTRMVLATG